MDPRLESGGCWLPPVGSQHALQLFSGRPGPSTHVVLGLLTDPSCWAVAELVVPAWSAWTPQRGWGAGPRPPQTPSSYHGHSE